MQEWLGDQQPTIAITLGSGLGGFGKDISGMREMNYEAFKLPICKVPGHAGKLRVIRIGQHEVLVFDGRAHYYEGHPMEEVVLGVRAAIQMGIKTHIITCASGGVNMSYRPGQIVIIKDHINLLGGNPLFGANDSKIGPRFFDMTTAYDPELRKIAEDAWLKIVDVDPHFNPTKHLSEGVYAALTGPNYETPAEVRMLRTLGVDMVGMSTVPEVTAINHLRERFGTRVLGLSCVTNLAAGVNPGPLSHGEVTDTAGQAAPRFRQLLTEIVKMIPNT